MKTRVVYLGDLEEVAKALAALPSVELVAWIAEKEDEECGAHYKVSSVSELAEILGQCGPLDLGIVANFGIIIPKKCLSVPKEGFINAHMGLLPKYPGRLPIQAALKAGETAVGVTLHRVIETVDEGPVLDTRVLAVGASRSAREVFDRMVEVIPKMIETYLQKR
jgi:methionyl-tRNA formyltransferase